MIFNTIIYTPWSETLIYRVRRGIAEFALELLKSPYKFRGIAESAEKIAVDQGP